MILSIMTLSVTTLSTNGLSMTLSIITHSISTLYQAPSWQFSHLIYYNVVCHHAECRHADCRFAKCCDALALAIILWWTWLVVTSALAYNTALVPTIVKSFIFKDPRIEVVAWSHGIWPQPLAREVSDIRLELEAKLENVSNSPCRRFESKPIVVSTFFLNICHTMFLDF